MPSPAERSAQGDEGRVALVTGAGGGLGSSCATALARRGMHVLLADLDGERAEQVARQLRDAPGEIGSAPVDVTNPAAVGSLTEQLVAERGRIDVVVNLAGVIRNQMMHKLVDADFNLVMQTHVHGLINTARAALPHMRSARYGRIVSMSSIAVRGSIAGSAYSAAKGAIEGITRSVAMEGAKHGITANCVAPGLINAGMFTTVPEEYQRESVARVPMGRAGEPHEVGACVAFLASSEASYVTGQTLFVCGGADLGF